MQIEFTNPKLMRKASKFHKFISHDLPEIAIMGKSNVGKSSFINHFLKSPDLALTSSKPGRTQEFFFFNVQEKVVFVDLPGYGYAQVSKTKKNAWLDTMKTYILDRPQLAMILLLIDSRRVPDEHDLEIFDLILQRELPMILVFTKIDKCKKNELKKNYQKILEAFDINQCVSVAYSSHDNKGRPQLTKLINEFFEDVD